eukprot:jgi/Botrbrau1/12728/Bobra.67_1s0088.1
MDQLLAACGGLGAGAAERVMDSGQLEMGERHYYNVEVHLTEVHKAGGNIHLERGWTLQGMLILVAKSSEYWGWWMGRCSWSTPTKVPSARPRFVVEKALKRGLRPLVVLNKVDRPSTTAKRCGEVESAVFRPLRSAGCLRGTAGFSQFFMPLPREGWVTRSLPVPGERPEGGGSMGPLL